MARIYMVRHGKTSTLGSGIDPGLSAIGKAQAEARAAALQPLGPFPILASPRRRTQETAQVVARRFSSPGFETEPAVGEVPMPGEDIETRNAWLREVMLRRWPELEAPLLQWRQGVIDRLQAITEDTVVVSHYVAINVALGAATGDDRVNIFPPDYCSCTIFESGGERLKLIERGLEGETAVLA